MCFKTVWECVCCKGPSATEGKCNGRLSCVILSVHRSPKSAMRFYIRVGVNHLILIYKCNSVLQVNTFLGIRTVTVQEIKTTICSFLSDCSFELLSTNIFSKNYSSAQMRQYAALDEQARNYNDCRFQQIGWILIEW